MDVPPGTSRPGGAGAPGPEPPAAATKSAQALHRRRPATSDLGRERRRGRRIARAEFVPGFAGAAPAPRRLGVARRALEVPFGYLERFLGLPGAARRGRILRAAEPVSSPALALRSALRRRGAARARASRGARERLRLARRRAFVEVAASRRATSTDSPGLLRARLEHRDGATELVRRPRACAFPSPLELSERLAPALGVVRDALRVFSRRSAAARSPCSASRASRAASIPTPPPTEAQTRTRESRRRAPSATPSFSASASARASALRPPPRRRFRGDRLRAPRRRLRGFRRAPVRRVRRRVYRGFHKRLGERSARARARRFQGRRVLFQGSGQTRPPRRAARPAARAEPKARLPWQRAPQRGLVQVPGEPARARQHAQGHRPLGRRPPSAAVLARSWAS